MRPYFITTLTWIVTRITRLPLSLLITPVKRMSISTNIRLVKWAWPDLSLPNLDTPFEPLPHENQTRWMFEVGNRQPEDPVIVFLHGGGYCFGLFPPFLSMLLDLYQMLGGERSRLSILVLDYSLCVQFPTQLDQLIEIYEPLKKTCKNIILLGDSAGGHLALSLIRHSQKPMQGVKPVVLGGELKHLVLLSPWINLWPDKIPGSSYDLFEPTDLLPTSLLKAMGVHFYDGPDKAALNPVDWEDLQLPKTFICCGSKECMRDDILAFAERYQIRPFVETKHGSHDSAPFWPDEIMRAVADFLGGSVM